MFFGVEDGHQSALVNMCGVYLVITMLTRNAQLRNSALMEQLNRSSHSPNC